MSDKKNDTHWTTLLAILRKKESIAVLDLAKECGLGVDNDDFKHSLSIVTRRADVGQCMGKTVGNLPAVVLYIKSADTGRGRERRRDTESNP